MFKTKEASQIVGVSKRTLQYYDDLGLLKITRDQSGNRIYDDETLEMIWKIMLLKEMRFSLKEIKQLIHSSKEEYEALLNHKILEIQQEIQDKETSIHLISNTIENGIIHPKELPEENYLNKIKSLKRELERGNKNE